MYREILICISPAILLMSFSVYSASLWQCHGSVMAIERHRFWKPPSVHTTTRTHRFHIYPPQRSFSKSIVFSVGILCFSLDGRTKRMHIDAFVDLPELVWTGPQLEAYQGLEWAVQPFNTFRPSENCSEKSKSFTYRNLLFFKVTQIVTFPGN